ncbi:MAG: hypothetical protein HY360_09420 [Verrucomicrobia bacterium]|nr:hypothetical protein [Verrucomicrobiota bacterium]
MLRKLILTLVVPLCLLWACIVLAPFFGINATAFRPLLDGAISLTTAAWFWLLAIGLGWRTFKLLRVFDDAETGLRPAVIRLLVSAGLGLGLMALVMFIVGTQIGVNVPVLLVTLLVLVVLVGPEWFGMAREARRIARCAFNRNWKRPEVFFTLAVLGMALLQLPAALTPTLYPDTLRYHFGLTRLFEQMGRIAPLPDFAEANVSSNWQMIYLPQLILAGDGCAQVFNWMTLPLTAAVAGLAAGGGATGVAAVTLISTPFLLGVAGLGNNDLGVTFFAALMWLVISESQIPARNQAGGSNPCPPPGRQVKSQISRWLLAGIFGGLAVGTKYPALMAVIAAIMSVAWMQGCAAPKGSRVAILRVVLVFLAGTFLGYAPWLARNLIWTGDPLYPALSPWLPWCDDNARWVASHYAREMTYYGSGTGAWFDTPWMRVLLAPWRLSVADGHSFESDAGVLFWCAAPIVAWAAWRQPRFREVRLAAGATLMGVFLWAIGAQVTRFLGPHIPAAAIAVGLAWDGLSNRLRATENRHQRRLCCASAIALVGINLWQTLTALAGFSDPYHFLLEGMTRHEYLHRQSGLYRLADWISRGEYAGSKILLLGEDGVYFFRNPVRISGPFNRKWIVEEAKASSSPSDLARRLKTAGIGLICVNMGRTNSLDARFRYMDWDSLDARRRFIDFMKNNTRLIRTEGPIGLHVVIE